MEGVWCIFEQRWKVSQWWWEVPTVLEWGVEDTLGGRRWLWVAEKQPPRLRRGICYAFFLIFTDCRNRRSLIFTDSVSCKFKIKIYVSYGLHKL